MITSVEQNFTGPDILVREQVQPPAARTSVVGALRGAIRSEPDDDGGMKFSRTMVNFWLDALLAMVFVALSIVAVIVQFVFPPGVGAKGWLLWRMNYGQWCSIQFGLLAFLGVGVVLHVMLHWTWVCSVIAKRLFKSKEMPDDGIRTVYGVGFLIVLLLTSAICVGLAMMTIQMPLP